jgi:hypothetical protein
VPGRLPILGGQDTGLVGQGTQLGVQGAGDADLGGGVWPGDAAGRGSQLVSYGGPVAAEVLAATAQVDRGRPAGRQEREPDPAGAQRFGQDERVEPVVLVPGRPLAAAQALDLVRADHHHGDPPAEQAIDDRAVWTLDRGVPGARRSQDGDQLAEPGSAVLDCMPSGLAAAGINDRHGIGEALSFRCRDLTAGSLTDRARRRSSLSMVGTLRLTARTGRTLAGRRSVRRGRR